MVMNTGPQSSSVHLVTLLAPSGKCRRSSLEAALSKPVYNGDEDQPEDTPSSPTDMPSSPTDMPSNPSNMPSNPSNMPISPSNMPISPTNMSNGSLTNMSNGEGSRESLYRIGDCNTVPMTPLPHPMPNTTLEDTIRADGGMLGTNEPMGSFPGTRVDADWNGHFNARRLNGHDEGGIIWKQVGHCVNSPITIVSDSEDEEHPEVRRH